MQYVQDYDESYPLRGFYDNSLNTGWSWRQVVQPYIKNTQVFNCPSNTGNQQVADTATTNPAFPQINISYAANDRIISGDYAHTLASIQAPAGKIIVCEIANRQWTDYGSGWWTTANGGIGYWTDAAFPGHSGVQDYLFADNHVKAMKPVATATPNNMWGGTDDAGGRDINVDTPVQDIVTGMTNVQNKYN